MSLRSAAKGSSTREQQQSSDICRAPAELTSPDGIAADIDATGNRTMLASSDALLLGAVNSLLKEARKIRKHLEFINDDTGDDITGDNE